MTGIERPNFEVEFENGQIHGADYDAKSLTYSKGWGRAMQVDITLAGPGVFKLREQGTFRRGARIKDVRVGYDNQLFSIAKNLFVLTANWSAGGDANTISVSAFGPLKRIDLSRRTRRLNGGTIYAAVVEVLKPYGIPLFIGNSAKVDAERAYDPSDTSVEDSQYPVSESTAPTQTSDSQNAFTSYALGIIAGNAPNISTDTRHDKNWCAQMNRQVIEGFLGLGVGQWEVAIEAGRIAGMQHHQRYAVNYAQAGRNLNLVRRGEIQPGDSLYQEGVSLPWGHVGTYVGMIDGVGMVLENTTVNRGREIFGIPGGPCRLTPILEFGTWTVAIAPNQASAGNQPQTQQPKQEDQTTQTVTNLANQFGGAGVIGSSVLNSPHKFLYQKNETDLQLVQRLGRSIGFTLTETRDSQGLIFGPGMQISNRAPWLLIRGDYSGLNTSKAVPKILSAEGEETLYGVPEKVLVTGIENGKRFVLEFGTDDLAARHKVTMLETVPSRRGNFTTPDSASGLGGTDTATPQNGLPTITTEKLTAQDFAGKKVGELLAGTDLVGDRLVLGGNRNQADAKERGLESLALDAMKYQQVRITTDGLPEITDGDLVLLEGSGLPDPDRGLYVVSECQGSISGEAQFTTAFTVNRNFG